MGKDLEKSAIWDWSGGAALGQCQRPAGKLV